MRLTKLTMPAETDTPPTYHASEAAASKERTRLQKLHSLKRGDGTLTTVNIPTDKNGLIDWLNDQEAVAHARKA